MTRPREVVPLVLGAGMLWAFAGTVLASSAAAATLGPRATTFVAVALGLAMMALAVRYQSVERSRVWAYFTAQSTLAVLVLVLGEGRGVLVVMPLLSQLALVARRRTVALYATGWAFAFACSFASHAPGLASVAGQVVGFLAAAVFTIVFTEVAIRERRARTESEKLARELAAAQTRIAELAVADERVRLAGEIHDGLGHALTAARMQIEGAAAVLDHDPARAKEALGKASRLVREGLVDVRQSVRALRPEADGARLEERLQKLVREAGDAVECDLVVRGEARPLSPAEEHALYRVAQEALTNVGRHAAAKRATVTFDRRAGALEIVDDGVGGAVVFGVGLTGMRERVERFGGFLVVDSRPGGGLRVRASLPPRADGRRDLEPTP